MNRRSMDDIIITGGVATSRKMKQRRRHVVTNALSLLPLLVLIRHSPMAMSFRTPLVASPSSSHGYSTHHDERRRRHRDVPRMVVSLGAEAEAEASSASTTTTTTTQFASTHMPPPPTTTTSTTLPGLYPKFANILSSKGYVIPTPIQKTSASHAMDGENLLLIAATGSGKTLAYFLPVLSRAGRDDEGRRRTVLIVAPTRELSAQLARDASLLLSDDVGDDGDANDDIMRPNVLLAVRGIPPPTPYQLGHATVLIGTPDELYAVLTRISGAQNFLACDALSGVILDEVDVLLPPEPKGLRTTFDGNDNDAQRERKVLERRRKLRAAQRRGVEFHGGSNMRGKSLDSMDVTSNAMNGRVLAPTERLLRLIASSRMVGHGGGGDGTGDGRPRLQLLAGSATASRAALDRLNRALKAAAMEGGAIGPDGFDDIWGGRMRVCRPEDGGDVEVSLSSDVSNPTAIEESAHTIRAVTVPSVVDHRYVFMSKDTTTNPREILANVAKIIGLKSPETSLVFICGEFSRSLSKEKEKEASKASPGKTSQARRNAKQAFVEKQKKTVNVNAPGGGPEPLSVRRACSILQSMDVDAHPMHVVLGLESNVGNDGTLMEEKDEDGSNEVELPPVLVTFEGSARGLHFDGVDYVFVVGRPTSAASYLHLAGRVGRAMPSDTASHRDVDIRPGTIVSFCSKGRVGELQKWTSQVGATGLEEIVL